MAQKGTKISPELIAETVKRVMATLGEETGKTGGFSSPGGGLDASRDYPLGSKRPDLVKSASGLGLEEITLDKVEVGQISFDDVKIPENYKRR